MKVHRGCAILIICLMSLEVTLAGIAVAQGAATAQIASYPSLDITLESFKGTLSPVTVEASRGDIVQVRVHSNYNGPVEHVGICLVVDGRYNPPGILSFISGSPPPSETRGESYYWDFGTTSQATQDTVMSINVSDSVVPCNSYLAFVEMGYYWKGESEDITTQPISIHIRCEGPVPPPPRPECTSGWTSTYRCVGDTVERVYINADCTEEWKFQDDCSKYSPERICKNGRCECLSGPPGTTQTYRCYNNQAQRLYINRNCSEVWQVKDDCNKYSPPRKCWGGVCVAGPTPPEPEPKKCDQAECQSEDGFFGAILCKEDGKTTYQKYKECNCADNTCKCIGVKKDVSKGIISGHVYDAVTKKPIAGATVVTPYIIYTPQRALQCASQTDANGYYKLYPCTPCQTFAPNSSYELSSCSAPGYETTGMMGTYTDKDGNAVVDFNLTRGDFNLVEIDPIQVIYKPPWFVVSKPTAVRLRIISTFAEPTLARVKLTYGDKKTFETNLEGNVLIKPDVEYYWIPGKLNENWSVPWFEFPAEGTYKISVKVASVDYTELDENNNGKDVNVAAEETKEIRVLYVPIDIGTSRVSDQELQSFAASSSKFINATYPIPCAKGDTAEWARFNELVWLGNVTALDILLRLEFNVLPLAKLMGYDQVVGVLPRQIDASWTGKSNTKIPCCSVVRIEFPFAPAHEIGHQYGLWSGQKEEVDDHPPFGKEVSGYWVVRHERVEKKFVSPNFEIWAPKEIGVFCLMGYIYLTISDRNCQNCIRPARCINGLCVRDISNYTREWIEGERKAETRTPPMGQILWIDSDCYEKLASTLKK